MDSNTTGSDRTTITRGVVIYLALAFALAWAAQIGVIAGVRSAGSPAAIAGGEMLIVALVLMWPPAVAAYVARRWVERSGFADAGLRWPRWRYVAYAWLGPAALTLVALALSLPLFPFDSSFSALQKMAAQAGQTLPAPPAVIIAVQAASGLTVAVLINCVFTFGEEFGWRGYLLPRLMTLFGSWPGILAHGAIWGIWHAPLILLISYNYPGHPVAGVFLFVVSTTLGGILLAWLRLASGSIVPAVIAHASLNAIAGLPLLLLRDVDPAIGGVIYSPIGWIALFAAIGLARRGGFPKGVSPQPARRLVIVGPQGSGKGTQAKLLSEACGIVHVSTGDIFRRHVQQHTALGVQVQRAIESGQLIADDVVTAIVHQRLEEPDVRRGFILDGFPRETSQARYLLAHFPVDTVIVIDVPDEVVFERALARRLCASCGADYNLGSHQPRASGRCDACGGELVTRPDDTPEGLRIRLQAYHIRTQPMVQLLARRARLITVNGRGSIDGVQRQLRAALGIPAPAGEAHPLSAAITADAPSSTIQHRPGAWLSVSASDWPAPVADG